MCEPVINKCNIPAKRPLLLLYTPNPTLRPSPMAQQVKNLLATQETQETLVWSLGPEDHLEKDTATHFSILAWEIPWTEEPGDLQFKWSQRAGHDWATEHTAHGQARSVCFICVYVSILYAWGYALRSWCLAPCLKIGDRQNVSHCQKFRVVVKSMNSGAKMPRVTFQLSVRFSLVAQSCPTLCNPMNRSTPGLPVHYQLPEFTQT